MGRKLFLPLTVVDDGLLPTPEVVRRRLGGRASTEAGAGELVSLRGEGDSEKLGVVLHVHGEALDVWIERGIVRHTRRTRTGPVTRPVPLELSAVARDARVFASLHEGQRVRYEHATGLDEATLVEKCRFGALLQRLDGGVVGVGFRRLWPLALPAREPN